MCKIIFSSNSSVATLHVVDHIDWTTGYLRSPTSYTIWGMNKHSRSSYLDDLRPNGMPQGVLTQVQRERPSEGCALSKWADHGTWSLFVFSYLHGAIVSDSDSSELDSTGSRVTDRSEPGGDAKTKWDFRSVFRVGILDDVVKSTIQISLPVVEVAKPRRFTGDWIPTRCWKKSSVPTTMTCDLSQRDESSSRTPRRGLRLSAIG